MDKHAEVRQRLTVLESVLDERSRRLLVAAESKAWGAVASRADLGKLVEPVTRGDPESWLHWTGKSVRKLAERAVRHGHEVSYNRYKI